MHQFDVIVIGGGHAGCEAAAAAARRGARTALVTMQAGAIGAMSCNPAIGGIGKGHLTREIDVFDGLIARAADGAAIHHRMLNASKGAAVRGPRVQADRDLFRDAVQWSLRSTPRLTIVEAEAQELVIVGGRVAGLRAMGGESLVAPAVVLATGTFLGGRLFRGTERMQGGRSGEGASLPLARQLRGLQLPMSRMKTGTPPRLDGRTVNWSRLDVQPSDAEPWTMSAMTSRRSVPQLFCAVTRTNGGTHDIIREAFDRSPLFSGSIEGQGPRYCPSIEDKVRRFGDRDGHQIFLEPEGLRSSLIYPNGISTSLPADVQEQMVRSIAGLESARVTQAGYAVEYDHVDPRSLDRCLAVRKLPGLYMAGQINGTTGYEEAAAQGLVAGLNAAAAACDLAPALFERADSYIGVMVDDLTLQGVTEPYRMLTARAEHRLHLRADNAEQRLAGQAQRLGCLSPERQLSLVTRQRWRDRCRDLIAPVADQVRSGGYPLVPQLEGVPTDIFSEIVEDERYAPYVARQRAEADAIRRNDRKLPSQFDFTAVCGLSLEMRERLEAAQPRSISEASRVRGMTPAAVSALMVATARNAA